MLTSHRGQRSMKLLGSQRGAGVLSVGGREVAVRYQMDTFEERNRRSVTGSLEGDISFAGENAAGSLKLASGEEIKVVLIKPDEAGADFQSN